MNPSVPATLCIAALLAIAILCAGCTGTGGPGGQTPPPSPSGTAIPVGNLVVTEEQDTATISMNQGNTVTVKLQENPTTGFQWNLSATPGLRVVNDTYVPAENRGNLTGVGGTRVWEISAAGKGEQKIDAVYRRSWEPLTGAEDRFTMTLLVS